VVYVLRTVKGLARSRRIPVPVKAKRLDGRDDSGEDTSVLERSQRNRRVVTKTHTSGYLIVVSKCNYMKYLILCAFELGHVDISRT
jgi:hypothetical protein